MTGLSTTVLWMTEKIRIKVNRLFNESNYAYFQEDNQLFFIEVRMKFIKNR